MPPLTRRDAVTDAVLSAVTDSGKFPEFVDALASELGWKVTSADAAGRVRQYFNGRTWRHLPAIAVLISIEVTGLDYVTPLLQRAAIRAEDRAHEKAPTRTMKVVRRDPSMGGRRDVG